jgi:hypothetical protein
MSRTAHPISPYTPRRFWAEHREVSLNWLALGILLAAWNASTNEPARPFGARDAGPAGWSSPEVSVRTRWARASTPG